MRNAKAFHGMPPVTPCATMMRNEGFRPTSHRTRRCSDNQVAPGGKETGGFASTKRYTAMPACRDAKPTTRCAYRQPLMPLYSTDATHVVAKETNMAEPMETLCNMPKAAPRRCGGTMSHSIAWPSGLTLASAAPTSKRSTS